MRGVLPPDWKDLGYLTPDAPECQRDVWALLARLQGHLGAALAELALRTAEPTWAAALADQGERARVLRDDLQREAGEAARQRLADDDAALALEGALDEVLASGHVPSLIVTGYAVLGELGTLPARLLEEVAGTHARLLCARVVAAETHRPLARLFGATDPSPQDRENLRRMLRHLNAQLSALYATWRQTFHVLGVDGEVLEEEAARTGRAAAEALGLKFTQADLAAFKA
jgi:hypothetical protein